MESCCDIHFPNLVIIVCNNYKQNLEGFQHQNWQKCFIIINYMFLCETFSENLCFISINIVILVHRVYLRFSSLKLFGKIRINYIVIIGRKLIITDDLTKIYFSNLELNLLKVIFLI